MANVAVTLLRQQFKNAHEWLDGTVGDIGYEHLHWQPNGLPSPIGAQYVHVVTVEDYFVSMLKGERPLSETTFTGRTGSTELPPEGPWNDWAERVRVDMEQARLYSQAVYEATDAYLASLTDAEIIENLNGDGRTRASVFSTILLNTYSHAGEISALKGLQGERGYPV